MNELVRYKLLKELPLYPAGTIVTHEYEVLPSKFNDGDYATDGKWVVKEGSFEVHASQYLEHLVKWCANSQRPDDNHEQWIEKL